MQVQKTHAGKRRIPYGNGEIFYLVPDAQLVDKLLAQGFTSQTPLTNSDLEERPTLRTELTFRGYVATKKFSPIDGLEALGFSYQRRRDADPEKTLATLIEREYSRDNIISALEGRTTLLTPSEFRHTHHRSYSLLSQQRGRTSFSERIRALHQDLFEDRLFPHLYAFISDKVQDVNLEVLRRKLLERFQQGLPLGASLKYGTHDERQLFSIVKTLGMRHAREERQKHHPSLFSPRQRLSEPPFSDMVSRITGLHPAYISRKESAVADDVGELGELFTRFVLYWTKAIDKTGRCYHNGFADYFPTPLGTIISRTLGAMSLATYNHQGRLLDGRLAHPDVRIDDWAVEVKCGTELFRPDRVEDLVQRYHTDSFFGGRRFWVPQDAPECLDDLVDQRPLEGSVIVFHTPSFLHEGAVHPLEQEGFKVLTPKTFEDYLTKLLHLLYENKKDVLQSTPGLYHVDSLLQLYTDLVHRPYLLERPSNHFELRWARDLLRHLADTAESHAYPDRELVVVPAVLTPPALSRSLGGRVEHNAQGSYLLVDHPVEELPCPSVTQALLDHSSSYVRRGVVPAHYRRFADSLPDRAVPLESLVVLDIEAATLPGREFQRGESVPFVIGTMAYEDGDFATRFFVSRTPAEERAALSAFASLLRDSSLMITFNGRTYDLEVLEQRMQSYSLSPTFPAHLDLLPVARGLWKQRLPNYQLKTLERVLYGHKREHDIPGSQIGEAYRTFLATADPTDMKRIITHNGIDLATIGTLFFDTYQRLRS